MIEPAHPQESGPAVVPCNGTLPAPAAAAAGERIGARRMVALTAWLVLMVLAGMFLFRGVWHNESERIIAAHHAFDPTWLANDWFLNIGTDYRSWFEYLAGPLFVAFPVFEATLIGRLATLLAFAVAFTLLATRLRLHPLAAFAAVMLFIHGHSWGVWRSAQSVIGSDWMVAAFENKPFAYALILVAVERMIRGAWRTAALCLGLATTFHVLVGAQATIAATPLFLIAWLRNREFGWRRVPAILALWAVGATMGLVAVVSHVRDSSSSSADEVARAAVLYVQRNAHMVDATAWFSVSLALVLVAIAAFLAAVVWRSTDRGHRLLAGFALGTFVVIGAGLVFSFAGVTTLQRYYWFRLPGTALALSVSLLLLSLLQHAVGGLFRRWNGADASDAGVEHAGAGSRRRKVQIGLTIAVLGLALAYTVLLGLRVVKWATNERSGFDRQAAERSEAMVECVVWIREHTPTGSVFLTSPTFARFSVWCERAQFVNWRHIPVQTANLLEWHRRCCAAGGKDPAEWGGGGESGLERGYRQLTAAQVAGIVARWPEVTHMLVEAGHDPFATPGAAGVPGGVTCQFQNAGYRVYDVTGLRAAVAQPE